MFHVSWAGWNAGQAAARARTASVLQSQFHQRGDRAALSFGSVEKKCGGSSELVQGDIVVDLAGGRELIRVESPGLRLTCYFAALPRRRVSAFPLPRGLAGSLSAAGELLAYLFEGLLALPANLFEGLLAFPANLFECLQALPANLFEVPACRLFPVFHFLGLSLLGCQIVAQLFADQLQFLDASLA